MQSLDFNLTCNYFFLSLPETKEQKIGYFGRFIDEKSDFSVDLSAKNRFSGGMETILTKKKSEEKKLVKNREKSSIFHRKIGKIRYFPKKIQFFPKF